MGKIKNQGIERMIKFNTILIIVYFVIATISYPYLRNSYFPQFPTKFERFIMWILASVWIVSVPVTFIMNQGDEAPYMETSYEGFVGSEA